MHRSKRLSAILSIFLTVAMFASACGSDNEGTAAPAATTAAPAATTAAPAATTAAPAATTAAPAATTAAPAAAPSEEGGTLRVGLNFARSGRYTLDQRLYAGNNHSFFLYMLHAPLVRVNPLTLEYTPYLAESYEVVNPQQLSVTLRSDALFHDGRPVTSADAKASIEATRDNEAADLNNVNGAIAGIESVEVVDDRTFLINFSAPSILTMFELLVGPETLISPADAGAEQDTAPVGTGPFKFASYEEGQSFGFEKFEEFFDSDNVTLDGIEYINLEEGTAQITALLGGDIDFASDTGVEGMTALDRDGFVPSALTDSIRYLYLTFCAADGYLWSDPLIRHAVMYATDRQQIVDVLYDGLGSPTDQWFPVEHPYYDQSLVGTYDLDIDKATALIEEAGGPFTDKMWAPNPIPEAVDLILLLNQQWGPAGLNLDALVAADLVGDALLPSIAQPPTLPFDAGSMVIENTRSGLQRLLRQIKAGSIVNSCTYQNPEMDEIAAELAATAPDDPKAAALWHRADKILLEDVMIMVLAQKPSFVGYSAGVSGIEADDFRGATEGSFQFQDWTVG
jgi:peptide/nickel transport system substrate-binding protein